MKNETLNKLNCTCTDNDECERHLLLGKGCKDCPNNITKEMKELLEAFGDITTGNMILSKDDDVPTYYNIIQGFSIKELTILQDAANKKGITIDNLEDKIIVKKIKLCN